MFAKINNNVSYVLKKRTPNIIKRWLIFLIISFIIIFVVALKYQYYQICSYVGYIKKVENYQLYIYVKEDVVSSIKSSKLFIDKKEYSFDINKISAEYYLVDNSNYYLIELNINLEDKYLIENNILNITLKNGKTTLFEELKKGFDL